jgi:cyanophycinase
MSFRRIIFSGLSILSTLAIGASAFAQERLVVIGGGPNRPPAAMKTFADWSGKKGNILVIAWASEIPVEVAAGITRDIKPHFRGTIEVSLNPPLTDEARAEFLAQLSRAGGVFFSGGNQTRIMDVFSATGGDRVRSAIEKAYAAGVAFGGTSAGTAIMSPMMILGDAKAGVRMDRGLGFLKPRGATQDLIVDQHFSQRNRSPRLIYAMASTKTSFGIGIDEDTALLVRDREFAEVVGEHSVRVFHLAGNDVRETSLLAGESLNLRTEKVRLNPSCKGLFR